MNARFRSASANGARSGGRGRGVLTKVLRGCTGRLVRALADPPSYPDLTVAFETWRSHVAPLYAEVLGDRRALEGLGRFLRQPLLDGGEGARALFGLHACSAAAAFHLAARSMPTDQAPFDEHVQRAMAGDLFFEPAFGFLAGERGPSLRDGVERWLERVRSDLCRNSEDQAEDELLRLLFHQAVPATVRYSFGEYHTPAWLARRALEELDEEFWRQGRMLDPGCGSGIFLTAALALLTERGVPAERAAARIKGYDISPLAVFLSRLNLAAAFGRLGWGRPAVQAATRCVSLNDSILGRPHPGGRSGRFEALVGNPPWVRWECLAPAYRAEVKKLIPERSLLFTEKGFIARLGGASDDLLTVFTALTCERYLADGGQLVYVVKQTLLTNRTGRAFRSLGAHGPTGRPLGFERIHDLTRLSGLFGSGQQQTALVSARLGTSTRFPVEYRVWRSTAEGPRPRALLEATARVPDDPGSAWLIRAPDGGSGLSLPQGSSGYAAQIRHGLKHDAEKVYALKVLGTDDEGVRVRAKGGGPEFVLEPDRIFPYIKPRHVARWCLIGWEHVLVPQDYAGQENEAELERTYPRTYRYLKRHEARLLQRRSSVFQNGPFYTLFGLGPYTWAKHRVVWCGLGHRPQFTVVSFVPDPVLGPKTPLPDGGCYYIPTDSELEAHYVAGMLNSEPVREFLLLCACGTKRALSKTALGRIALPRFDSHNPDMREIARLASRAPAMESAAHLSELDKNLAQRVLKLLGGSG